MENKTLTLDVVGEMPITLVSAALINAGDEDKFRRWGGVVVQLNRVTGMILIITESRTWSTRLVFDGTCKPAQKLF
jgi:hypothetical protein